MTKINTEIEAFLTKHGKRNGVPISAITALKRFGVFDAQVLTVLSVEEIHRIPNISERTAQALKQVVSEKLGGVLFQQGTKYIETRLKTRKYFTTGAKSVDKLLDGGLRTGTLIEVAGDSRSGKTQFCMTCAVTAQLPEEDGGLNSPVIYIDTTNSFDVQHYLRIGERFRLKQEDLLKNLIIVKADRLMLLKQALDRLPGYMQAMDAKLVVVDSFIAPYEHEHPMFIESEVVQKEFNHKLGLLKRLATGFNSVVIITNHVIANLQQSRMFIPVLIAGGHAFTHTTDLRLFFKKLRGNMRRVKVEHCSWLPMEHEDFYITPRGIYDEEVFPEELLHRKKVQTETEEESLEYPLMEALKEIAELEVEAKPSKSKNAQKKVK